MLSVCLNVKGYTIFVFLYTDFAIMELLTTYGFAESFLDCPPGCNELDFLVRVLKVGVY
jgi:hypothetical protein